MGSAVHDISNLVSGAGKVVSQGGKNLVNNAGLVALNPNFMPAAIAGLGNSKGGDNGPTPPPDPLAAFQKQQLQYAQDFRSNLPQMQKQTQNTILEQNQSQMDSQLRQNKEKNSARGLGYGGIAQGQQAQIQGQTAQNTGQELSTASANLNNAANTLDAQAVESGLGVQQNSQMLQNQAYQQAMAQANTQNQLVGNMMGTGLLATVLMA